VIYGTNYNVSTGEVIYRHVKLEDNNLLRKCIEQLRITTYSSVLQDFKTNSREKKYGQFHAWLSNWV